MDDLLKNEKRLRNLYFYWKFKIFSFYRASLACDFFLISSVHQKMNLLSLNLFTCRGKWGYTLEIQIQERNTFWNKMNKNEQADMKSVKRTPWFIVLELMLVTLVSKNILAWSNCFGFVHFAKSPLNFVITLI